MQISIDKLRKLSELLLTHVEEFHGSTFQVDHDYYWDIDREERVNPYRTPEKLDIGQLSDDWENLSSILSGEQDPLGYGLVWLSSILRTVGENTVS